MNGATVTTKDVVDELDAITANPGYLSDIDSQFKQGGQTVVGSASGTFDAGFVGQVAAPSDAVRGHPQRGREAQPPGQRRVQAGRERTTWSRTSVKAMRRRVQTTLDGFPEDYRNRLEGWYVDEWLLQSDLVQQPCGGAASPRRTSTLIPMTSCNSACR